MATCSPISRNWRIELADRRRKKAAFETAERRHAASLQGREAGGEALSARRVRGTAWDHPAVGALDMRAERLRLATPMATDSAEVFAILGNPRTAEHNGLPGRGRPRLAFTSRKIQ
jgi:hypothetical protein